MNAAAWDAATAHTAPEIERAIGPVDDLLRVCRSGSTHEILQAVRFELESARQWRIDNMAGADEVIRLHEAERLRSIEAAYWVDVVRCAVAALGPQWRHVVPLTAWRARRHVHLPIIEAEHDPAALSAALDRVYGAERTERNPAAVTTRPAGLPKSRKVPRSNLVGVTA